MKLTFTFLRECFLALLLLIACTAGYLLAKKYSFTYNLAPSQTLSETTCSLLELISDPISVTLFSTDIETHHQAQLLITKYQANKSNIVLTWQAKPYAHSSDYQGPALLVTIKDKQHIIDLLQLPLGEQTLTQTLFKLHNQHNQWVAFLQGHNEPDPFGTRATDFSLFRIALQNQGLNLQTLKLTQTPVIAHNTRLLIIASPKVAFLPLEEKLITDYVSRGGSLLWLMDNEMHAQPFLSSLFQVNALPGTIVDLHGHHLGTPHPAITVVDAYPTLPFTAPKSLTAFPFSVALKQQLPSLWESKPLLVTDAKSWTETGPLTGVMAFESEKNEVMGPLLLGLSLSKQHPTNSQLSQRIAIIGNSRFLSNGVIENYGNLAFGLNLIHWLGHDDHLVTLTQPINTDEIVQIHLLTALWLQYGFPLLILLGIIALILNHRRRLRLSR